MYGDPVLDQIHLEGKLVSSCSYISEQIEYNAIITVARKVLCLLAMVCVLLCIVMPLIMVSIR